MKFVARLSYGEALPSDAPLDGAFRVFGSNGPFASFSRANTGAPAIIIGRKGSYGKVNWTEEPCFASDTTFFVDEFTSKNNLRWLYWLLQTLRLDEGTDEAAVPGLNRETVYDRNVLVPALSEQCAIADYLDRETARLDALVTEKERLLDLLAEKRQALITRAVTRGLDLGVSYRVVFDSWIGKIPEHWTVRKIAWLFRERDLRGQPNLPLLKVSIGRGAVVREFSEERIENTAADFNTYKVARQGDIVFNKMRMWQGAVGAAPRDGLVSPDYVVAQPTGDLSSPYASLMFRTAAFSAESARHSHGIVWDRLRLYWEGFREIMVPLPPVEEQLRIVEHIESETGKLDEVGAATLRTIVTLKERRVALISAAVTGQIDVEEKGKE